MKSTRLGFTLLLGAALFSACSSNKQEARSVQAETIGRDFAPGVKIVYSANVAAEIEPCGCRANPAGGLSRKWNMLAGEDRKGLLILDSGDLFYASFPTPPFLQDQWNLQAETLVQAYNAMGCDAFAPGDLDFASGLQQLEKLRDRAKFPFVSANVFSHNEPYFAPYKIIEKKGVKIAVFGLYDEELALPNPLFAKPHLEVAKALVPQLRKKATAVIALTHLGLEKDIELAKAVPGIDAIFGAHTQSFLQDPVRVGDTMIFQTSFRNQHVGTYFAGQNAMVALDSSFDRESDSTQNPMRALVNRTKERIADLNRKNEEEFGMTSGVTIKTESSSAHHGQYQTFTRCVECHQPQYDFYKGTRHAGAYMTLVKAKQNFNKDCLKCHTVGMNEAGGWKRVDRLVFNAAGKPVPPDSFAKGLPKMTAAQLLTYRQAFINVQCENCHGPADNHPFSGQYPKAVSTNKCLQCHTETQAPGWYKAGKPNQELIELKKKSISCPAST